MGVQSTTGFESGPWPPLTVARASLSLSFPIYNMEVTAGPTATTAGVLNASQLTNVGRRATVLQSLQVGHQPSQIRPQLNTLPGERSPLRLQDTPARLRGSSSLSFQHPPNRGTESPACSGHSRRSCLRLHEMKGAEGPEGLTTLLGRRAARQGHQELFQTSPNDRRRKGFEHECIRGKLIQLLSSLHFLEPGSRNELEVAGNCRAHTLL